MRSWWQFGLVVGVVMTATLGNSWPGFAQNALAPAPVIRAVRIDAAVEVVDQQATEPKAEQAIAQPVAVDDSESGVLSLINGNTLPGDLRPSKARQVLHWQGDHFIEPFQFRTDAIKSIKFPPAAERRRQQGQFSVELVSGDLLSGDLVSWKGDEFVIDAPLFGPVGIKPSVIRRLYRIQANPTIVFASLSGLRDWQSTAMETSGWIEDGAQLWTDKVGAVLSGDLEVPEKAVIEFEISWQEELPNFSFVIAADTAAEDDGRMDGWRIETFQDMLAVVRETEGSADLAPVLSLKDTKRLRLLAFLDQSSGALEIYQPDGTQLAKIQDPNFAADDGDSDSSLQHGIRLINRFGTMRLESLRVSRWTGRIPTSATDGNVMVTLVDGSIVSGDSAEWDEASSRLILEGRGDEGLDLQDVVSVKLAAATDPSQPPEIAAFLHDGTRISGELFEVTDQTLVFRDDAFTSPISVSREQLRTLIVLRRDPLPADPSRVGRSGRLELGGHKLEGHLVSATENQQADMSCFCWQPLGSINSSSIRFEAGGRIVYRDPPVTPEPATNAVSQRGLKVQELQLRQQKRGLDFAKLFLEKVDSQPSTKPISLESHRLHIRSGDVIPCSVKTIDEKGVYVSTVAADDSFVPHTKIKAVELVPNAKPPSLNEAKKQRLLTLPRLQKNSPPTHLLCSRSGDFLRCRLLGISETRIRVELQLEEIEIPRDRVAQIIWFHPEELIESENDQQQEAEVSEKSMFLGLAQVLKRDGKRVTFDPTHVDGKHVVGVSDVLGNCKFELEQVDQVLFGDGIGESVANLLYNQWQLSPAIEPLMARIGEDGEPVLGQESPLIGTDAPEIRLEMLDGSQFVLSQCQGQIVVLDFWASWCAPCMRTMPLVEEALSEFDSNQVRLVAVNLEESQAQIESVLDRHEMQVPVAMDIDGVAAANYQANAIPQMVIIDRQGKIARLFVGGGSDTVDGMTAAIEELLETSP